jgi:hypothetical protein
VTIAASSKMTLSLLSSSLSPETVSVRLEDKGNKNEAKSAEQDQK